MTAHLFDLISKMLQPTNRRDAIYRVSGFIASLIVAPVPDFGSNWRADAINRVSTGRISLSVYRIFCLWLTHLANQVIRCADAKMEEVEHRRERLPGMYSGLRTS